MPCRTVPLLQRDALLTAAGPPPRSARAPAPSVSIVIFVMLVAPLVAVIRIEPLLTTPAAGPAVVMAWEFT